MAADKRGVDEEPSRELALEAEIVVLAVGCSETIVPLGQAFAYTGEQAEATAGWPRQALREWVVQPVADSDASVGRGDHGRGGAEAVVPVAHQAALANGLMEEDAIAAARHEARRNSPGKTEARPEVVTVGLPLPAAHAA